MAEYRTFRDREVRLPTAAEVRRRQQLEEQGIADVYLPIESGPPEFWEAVLQAADWALVSMSNLSGTSVGQAWWDELRWQEGWPPRTEDHGSAFASIVRSGRTAFLTDLVDVHLRLSAIEHLIDVVESSGIDKFSDLFNEAAERFRVGIRLEGSRFVDVTSEHIHEEVVRPALLLLAGPKFEPVDALYRKGYDRLLAGDPAGAITAACSAIEEMLRTGGYEGTTLLQLAQRAVSKGWITPGVQQSIVKLDAYRGDSDAHTVGTDEKELARLVLHQAGSLLLYLGRTLKNVP